MNTYIYVIYIYISQMTMNIMGKKQLRADVPWRTLGVRLGP